MVTKSTHQSKKGIVSGSQIEIHSQCFVTRRETQCVSTPWIRLACIKLNISFDPITYYWVCSRYRLYSNWVCILEIRFLALFCFICTKILFQSVVFEPFTDLYSYVSIQTFVK